MGADFYSLYAKRFEPGNGERIDKALHAIEEANITKLDRVFQDISFNSGKLGEETQKNDLLRLLLEDFNKPTLNLRPSRVGTLDIIGNAYEYLIKMFASDAGKKAGEYYTPAEVSQLIAELVDPQEGDEICDPACGSASLLMKCGYKVRDKAGARKYALFGQESIGSTWSLAKMNLFLHGEDNHKVEWGDTLRNPLLLDGNDKLKHFDVVVANPPFSLDKWGQDSAADDKFGRFRRGLPPRTKGDYAFILHMVFLCKALLLHPALAQCRIIVVTDRVDLEKQLAGTFQDAGAYGGAIASKSAEKSKAKSGRDLALRIGKGVERIIFTLVQKFNSAAKLKECHNPSEDIIVLVDEGHRSQQGGTHERMTQQSLLLIIACGLCFTPCIS